MMKPDLLIIFYRNPELGKVKTRLAATVGDGRALAIYLKLAAHTRSIASEVNCDRVVWYSDFVDTEDNWPNDLFLKDRQVGDTLGDRMHLAFDCAFQKGYQRVCIIGTDCLELTGEILNESFNKLITHDAVIGPALDGGYYLLGMKQLHTELFSNKVWGNNTVYKNTVKDFEGLNITFGQLPCLTDIDEEKDLPARGI
ncbi:MAG: TIGR04282 family arsenosugar biosynthesis glycosyltransferase [Cyclobacteriaceae bacterium]|nr:TIGR04282 family arsenosugar biosynthesis glycosyltransferase [Cyclobacteriaceae bacterium]